MGRTRTSADQQSRLISARPNVTNTSGARSRPTARSLRGTEEPCPGRRSAYLQFPHNANRLRAARLAAGLTQEALGVATGIAAEVARTRINRYERGVNECDLRTAKKLADALGMPLA